MGEAEYKRFIERLIDLQKEARFFSEDELVNYVFEEYIDRYAFEEDYFSVSGELYDYFAWTISAAPIILYGYDVVLGYAVSYRDSDTRRAWSYILEPEQFDEIKRLALEAAR